MILEELKFGTELLKRGFASMQKGGVIMDVVSAEQAVIAENAGAVAVMALERVPADIRKAGGFPGWQILQRSSRSQKPSQFR
jgi:pyridoxal phosphate synthase yaaD subunit